MTHGNVTKQPEQPSLNVAPPTPTQDEINEWYATAVRMSQDKVREMELRKKIFAYFFQAPIEGVNDAAMTDGFVMKGTYKIDRKVKEELLSAHAEELKGANLPMQDLIKLAPSLSVAAYKKLNDDQRKLFDKILEIKPGAPSLEFVKPKRT